MSTHSLVIVILAAGKGTRMKSAKAKVLHEVVDEPMIVHVVNSSLPLNPQGIVVVIGHQKEAVADCLSSVRCTFAVQTEQLGTGHAVLTAEEAVGDSASTVMILYGDTPLIKSTTLAAMYQQHRARKSDITLLTTVLDDPTNYGRILTDSQGNPRAIVEQKDCLEEQLSIHEVNAGIYCVDAGFLFSSLKKVGTDNQQGEIYLTDIVELAVNSGLTVHKFMATSPMEVLGVNSRLELSEAQRELQLRRNHELMDQGVSMISPETIRVSADSVIGCDTLLAPCVHISRGCKLGRGCTVEQGAVLENCTLGDNVRVGAGCCFTDKVIADGMVIGPHSTEV